MYLKHLSLTNFRNYTRLEIDLPARISLLQGENAQGKTNFLEAIYYLATTRSPLASADRQLISWAAEEDVIPYARLEGLYTRGGEDHTLEMILVKERQPEGGSTATVFRRQIRLDGVNRRALDVVGKLNVVLFLPEDVTLVSGSPEERRHFLDVALCQIDPLYCASLSRYNRVVAQRNALLHQIREGRAGPNQLEYWDEQLVKEGAYVLSKRLWATEKLNAHVSEIHPALTGEQERLVLLYRASVAKRPGKEILPVPDGRLEGRGSSGELAEPRLAEAFRRALQEARREEIARGVTIIGPHRDDLTLLVNGIDMTIYGSRGQQRTVALALKLAEVGLMHQQAQEMPILLLDDVISELDRQRGEFLLKRVSQAQQVLITTTDLRYYAPDFLASVALWRVAGGTIVPLQEVPS